MKNVPNWSDINPRVGAAYDLFGNGKTAVKAFLGRYVNFEAFGITTANNPSNLLVLNATRAWTDANGDYVPQESELGPLSDSAFRPDKAANHEICGRRRPRTQRCGRMQLADVVPDPARAQAGPRGEPRLLPHVAWQLHGDRQPGGCADRLQPVLHHRAVHPHLPSDVSGKQICGLYDLNPAKFGIVDNPWSRRRSYGDNRSTTTASTRR